MRKPLMPKATASWLIENTSLSFKQISNFVGLHILEVQAIADGEVSTEYFQEILSKMVNLQMRKFKNAKKMKNVICKLNTLKFPCLKLKQKVQSIPPYLKELTNLMEFTG